MALLQQRARPQPIPGSDLALFLDTLSNRCVKISNGVRTLHFTVLSIGKERSSALGHPSKLLALGTLNGGQLKYTWFLLMSLRIPHCIRPNRMMVFFILSFSFCDMPLEMYFFFGFSSDKHKMFANTCNRESSMQQDKLMEQC
jgi:hypothetical protein